MLTTLLSVHWHVNPILFHIGSLEIRWYGLLFVSGFVIGWYLFRWFFTREQVDRKLMDPLLYTLLIATIVGARLGHCIFYQPDYYFGSWQSFWEIFMPWKGGLASHGGAIALLLGLIMVWIYKNKLDKVHRGFFFGFFLLGCFGARFLIEFIKEPQVDFEKTMLLDMGQLLSIPFILAGIGLLVYAAKAKKPAAVVHPQPVRKEPTHYARGIND